MLSFADREMNILYHHSFTHQDVLQDIVRNERVYQKIIRPQLVEYEKQVAKRASEIYAGLGKNAREAFVNQLEGMAFVLSCQKREDKPEEEKKEAS